MRDFRGARIALSRSDLRTHRHTKEPKALGRHAVVFPRDWSVVGQFLMLNSDEIAVALFGNPLKITIVSDYVSSGKMR